MTFTSGNIVKQLGAWLAAQGVGTWSPNANYTASQPWPIFVGQIPESTAITNAVLLNKYADSRTDDSQHDDESPHIYIQFRIRGTKNPFTAEDKADDIFQLLHDSQNIHLGNGAEVLLCRRTVTAPQEPDANGRWHSIDSYRFTLNPGRAQ